MIYHGFVWWKEGFCSGVKLYCIEKVVLCGICSGREGWDGGSLDAAADDGWGFTLSSVPPTLLFRQSDTFSDASTFCVVISFYFFNSFDKKSWPIIVLSIYFATHRLLPRLKAHKLMLSASLCCKFDAFLATHHSSVSTNGPVSTLILLAGHISILSQCYSCSIVLFTFVR